MYQNTKHTTDDIRSEWHDLHALWSDGPPESDVSGPTFEMVGGGRTLMLASGRHRAHDSRWVPFRFRNAHPSEKAIAPIDAPYLLAVRVMADDDDRDEFRRWLDDEHCRLQVGLRDVRWFLGYEETGPVGSFLNLWGIDDPAVVDSEAWTSARDTPWWQRVSHVPANSDRGVYRLVGSELA